jgi:hypothetical protein
MLHRPNPRLLHRRTGGRGNATVAASLMYFAYGVVFPIPAIPSIAWIPTTPPLAVSASIAFSSCVSSA